MSENAHSLMLEALKLAEWAVLEPMGDTFLRLCPVCRGRMSDGHWSFCKLAAAIREGEKASALSTDTGKQYLAIVEAARRYVEAEQALDDDRGGNTPYLARQKNAAYEALKAALGGDSQ